MFSRLPSFRGRILALGIECLDVNVFHRRPDIGKAPCDSLIVSDDHVGHAGQRDASDVKAARAQMSFIPEVRHLVSEMHIVRQQWLSRHRVRAGNHPIVGTDHHAGISVRI